MNFQIESTSYCDLTCIECVNHMMQRKRQMMAPEVWDRILHDYVIPYKHLGNPDCPPTVIPHKDGEPWLNKRLPDYLRSLAAADPSIKIDVYSHGLLLPRLPYDPIDFLGSLPNRCRLLLSFHFHNHDGSTNDYTQTTAYLTDLFSSGRQPRNVEFIMVSHLVKPMTRELLDNWKKSWAWAEARGAVTVHANASINPWTGLIEDENCSEFSGCPYGDFGHVFFGATGNIIACCMDLEEEIVFGNVMQDDPAAMMEKLRAFYEEQGRIRRGESPLVHGVCSNCMGMGKRQDLVQIGVPA